MVRTYGSVRVSEPPLSTYSVNDVLERLRSSPDRLEIDGVVIDVAGNLRLQLFAAKGVICVACGLEASYFALEQVASDGFEGVALNLYGEVDGVPVLFTKDHTTPSSRGGSDSLANLEPMCWPCNGSKGNRIT